MVPVIWSSIRYIFKIYYFFVRLTGPEDLIKGGLTLAKVLRKSKKLKFEQKVILWIGTNDILKVSFYNFIFLYTLYINARLFIKVFAIRLNFVNLILTLTIIMF